ncbi:hypothetical protein BC938DRAFT_470576, partial [Jimgerdemannia flammicorona]
RHGSIDIVKHVRSHPISDAKITEVFSIFLAPVPLSDHNRAHHFTRHHVQTFQAVEEARYPLPDIAIALIASYALVTNFIFRPRSRLRPGVVSKMPCRSGRSSQSSQRPEHREIGARS